MVFKLFPEILMPCRFLPPSLSCLSQDVTQITLGNEIISAERGKTLRMIYMSKQIKQAGAELSQAQLPIGS